LRGRGHFRATRSLLERTTSWPGGTQCCRKARNRLRLTQQTGACSAGEEACPHQQSEAARSDRAWGSDGPSHVRRVRGRGVWAHGRWPGIVTGSVACWREAMPGAFCVCTGYLSARQATAAVHVAPVPEQISTGIGPYQEPLERATQTTPSHVEVASENRERLPRIIVPVVGEVMSSGKALGASLRALFRAPPSGKPVKRGTA
jgi:hypothetical protein